MAACGRYFFLIIFLVWAVVPQQLVKSKTLTLCVLFERNTTGKTYDYNRGGPAMDLAIQYVQESVLPAGYHLEKVFRDLGDVCSSKTHTVAQAMDLLNSGIDCSVFVGPGCGTAAESLSDLAEFHDIPMIGVPAAGMGLSASFSLYTTVARVSVAYSTIASALLNFLADQNYTTPAFFEDQSISFFEQLSILSRSTFRTKNFDLFASSAFYQFSSANYSEEKTTEMLQKASLQSRVFVIYGNAKTVRRLMIAAYRAGMTRGDYVFIAIELFSSDIWGRYTWMRNDSNDAIAKDAFQSLLLLSLQPDYSIDTAVFWREIKKLAKSSYGYKFPDGEEIDYTVLHCYDAIVLYGETTAALTRANKSLGGLSFVDKVANSTIFSPVSGEITFDAGSDRLFDFTIRSFDHNSGKHEALYGYPGKGGPMQVFATLDWFGNDTLPPNTPRCGFNGKDPACQEKPREMTKGETASAVILPLLFAAGLVLGGYYLVQQVCFHDADPFWWRIFLHEIDSNAVSTRSETSGGASFTSKQIEKQATGASVDGDQSTVVDLPSDKSVKSIGGVRYSITELSNPKRVPSGLSSEVRAIRRLQNVNLQKLIGIVVNEDNQCVYVVGELCARGTLQALIADAQIQLDWAFKNSLLKDLANGMAYLHSTNIGSHGFLSDETCRIDSRFVLKVAMYGFGSLQSEDDLIMPSPNQLDRNWRILLWRAPELLRRTMPQNGTQKGDAYSYAILMQQIILRTDPFEMVYNDHFKRMNESPRTAELVMEVKRGSMPPTRPTVPMSACSAELHELMCACWDEDHLARPSFSRVKVQIMKIVGKSGDNIVDHLIRRMETYASGLEFKVEQQMRQFMEERQRSQDLLQTLLPKPVALAMLQGLTIYPETFSSTTVYFGDVHGFSEAVESVKSPFEVVSLLNRLYGLYDEVTNKYDVFQVEAVNDAFLVVSGVPVTNGIRHVDEIASMALDIRRKVAQMKTVSSSSSTMSFKLRVGINSGPVVAGVVGLQLPRYCLFGDAVNTASRMESHGEAGKIQCSGTTKTLLDEFPEFVLIERGEQNIKGKGLMMTYWIVGKN